MNKPDSNKLKIREFGGNLDQIEPSLLMKKGTKDEVADFFLVLATIFNDVKGLMFFSVEVNRNYRSPAYGEVSCHSGEYSGIRMQLNKLFLATVYEFFFFLRENQGIFGNPQFVFALSKLGSNNRRRWKELVEVALDKGESNSDFRRTLNRVRSNVAFHYYESDKILRKGFVDRFEKTPKSHAYGNDFAYFSIAESMKDTRFYYADAAVQEFIKDQSKTDAIKEHADYYGAFSEVLESMNQTISALLGEYLNSRRFEKSLEPCVPEQGSN